jgi:hypothetical protein
MWILSCRVYRTRISEEATIIGKCKCRGSKLLFSGWDHGFDSKVAAMRDNHFEFIALFRGLGKEYHHMIQKLGSPRGTILEARIPSIESTRARGHVIIYKQIYMYVIIYKQIYMYVIIYKQI